MHLLADSLSWSDRVGLVVVLIGAIGGAVASCLAAWRTGKVHAELRPPSNGVTNGAITENTAVALSLLTHMFAEQHGQDVRVPTPRETQAQIPGSTLAAPPPPVPGPPGREPAEGEG